MSSPRRLFLLAGLLLGLALAMFVSPFASGSPDGLEKVAEEEGFAETATDHQFGDSPLADYSAEGVDDERAATAVSGLIGVLVTFGLGVGVFAGAKLLRSTRDPVAAT